jgi:hypothetical protein
MANTRRSVSLNLESLETRVQPSVAPLRPFHVPPHWTEVVVVPPPVPKITAPPKAPTLTTTTYKPPVSTPVVTHTESVPVISGGGTYVCTLQFSNVPSGFHFAGLVNVPGMGTVSAYIDLYGVGFNSNSTAHGTATFTNGLGTITISLTGPVQPRLSPLPQDFTYKTISSSGPIGQFPRIGTLQIFRTPSASPFRDGIEYIELGNFSMEIR